MYEGTWDSVRTHAVPDWYEDAKLGVFLHWGPYSVPGWAPRVPDIQEMLLRAGPRRMLRENPYAEWYFNTMRIKDSPTAQHHAEVYGDDYPYDNFGKTFNDATAVANLDALAGLCADAGARYVVLTTKHHDGFALWPTAVPHPVKGEYHARRDLVGDLTAAVRRRRMRMGLYYSGGYDWPYNDALVRGASDLVLAAPAGSRYRTYVTEHVRELIDWYAPSVLWNDISWPAGGNLAELFAYFYNKVPEGVINDRWREVAAPRGVVSKGLVRAAGRLLELAWPLIPARHKRLTFASPEHCDFRTPEYEMLHTVSERKWEMCRGVGRSFGANREEPPEDIISETELIQTFCDVVANNGNLLIGVGPRPDGTVPESQQAPLRGLGDWLAANGEAVYGSRPWVKAESATSDGTPLRFTKSGEGVYALVLGMPAGRWVTLQGIDAARVRRVRLVASDELVDFSVVDGGSLRVTLPERLPVSAVTAFDLGAEVRARVE
jgi:alpha-L-fucosidase